MINSIDFYSSKPIIRINNKEMLVSFFGAITSIVNLSIIVAFSWLFGKDIILKENPNVKMLEMISSDIPNINLSPNNSLFAFSVNYGNDDSIATDFYKFVNLSVSLINFNYNRNPTYIINNLEQVPCEMYKNSSDIIHLLVFIIV